MSKRKAGFTLIELLVVILIIGVLAAIGLPQYLRAVEKAKFATGIAILNNVNKAQAVAQTTLGGYTSTLTDDRIELSYSSMTATTIVEKYFTVTYVPADVSGTLAASYTLNALRTLSPTTRYGAYTVTSTNVNFTPTITNCPVTPDTTCAAELL